MGAALQKNAVDLLSEEYCAEESILAPYLLSTASGPKGKFFRL